MARRWICRGLDEEGGGKESGWRQTREDGPPGEGRVCGSIHHAGEISPERMVLVFTLEGSFTITTRVSGFLATKTQTLVTLRLSVKPKVKTLSEQCIENQCYNTFMPDLRPVCATLAVLLLAVPLHTDRFIHEAHCFFLTQVFSCAL